MAVEKPNEIEGVNLPYKKIQYFEGNKNEVNVVLAYSSSKDARPLHSESVILTESQKKELGDSITRTLYLYLKDQGLIDGDDC